MHALDVRQSKQFLEPLPFLSILDKTSGNFLIYDFFTPPFPTYQFCTWISHVIHSPGPNITPGPYLTWHRYFCEKYMNWFFFGAKRQISKIQNTKSETKISKINLVTKSETKISKINVKAEKVTDRPSWKFKQISPLH